MNEPCFPCDKNPCEEIVHTNCEKTICNSCEETYDANCIIVTETLISINGDFYIKSGVTIQQAFKELITKINDQDKKIKHILETCCASTTCEIPVILNII